jgi:hypothetical protein
MYRAPSSRSHVMQVGLYSSKVKLGIYLLLRKILSQKKEREFSVIEFYSRNHIQWQMPWQAHTSSVRLVSFVRQCLSIVCFGQYISIHLLSLTNQHTPDVQYAEQLWTEHSSYRRSTLRFYLPVLNSGIWAARIKMGSRVAACNTRNVSLSSNRFTDNYNHHHRH